MQGLGLAVGQTFPSRGWEMGDRAVNDRSRSPLRRGSENSSLAPQPPPSSSLCSPWSFPTLASDSEALPRGAPSWCQPSLLQPAFGPPPLLCAYRKRHTGPTYLYPPHPRPSHSPFHRWGNPSPSRMDPQRGCFEGPAHTYHVTDHAHTGIPPELESLLFTPYPVTPMLRFYTPPWVSA